MTLPRNVLLQAHRTKVALHGERVIYVRGPQVWEVDAVLGQRPLRISDDSGVVEIIWGLHDFLIAAADLPVEPQQGDQIRRSTLEGTEIYEVAAPGEEPVWRWSDNAGVVRRVHSKHLRTEPPS
jgi:hypothetical protein